MRQERQTALKETAELRRELNGGGGPLGPARLAEIRAQLDAKMAAATRRKEEMLRREKRRKREENAARLSAAAARVANQREEKHAKIAVKVAGKDARREDLKDRSRGRRANIARRFDEPTHPDAIRTADAHAPRSKPRRVGAHPRRVDPDDPDDASESAHSCPRSESDVDAASVASEISLSNDGYGYGYGYGSGSVAPLSARRAPRATRLRTAPHVAVPYNPRGVYLTTQGTPTPTPTPRTNEHERRRLKAGWNDRVAVLDRTVADAPARIDEVEKSNARIAALRAAAEARWNAVNTTAEAARREYGTPAGLTGRVQGVPGDENKGTSFDDDGSFDENAPPTPPGFEPSTSALSKGLRSSLDDADSRRSSEEFTFSPPPAPAAASLANLSALMSSARSSSSSSMKPFASTPTPIGVSSDGFDDASIRESAMKVLDSPEAAAAAALSEELLARLEEESALMESLTESGDDGMGLSAASFVDPIDSWLAKAQRAGAKGVAESRELRLALASSRTHRDDYNDKGGTETEEETEEEDGPGPGSPAWTVWANASMEARRDENSPLGFAAFSDVNVARGGVSWLSPISTTTRARICEDRRTADSVPTALFRDEEREPADEEPADEEPADEEPADEEHEGFETVERGNARASIDDSPERRAAAAKLLEDELEAASAIEAAAGQAARAAEARAERAEEEAAKLAKEVADARARARAARAREEAEVLAARAREEAEVRARAREEAEAARVAASVQSAVDDDTLWRGRFGTSGGSGAKGAAKEERSPAKKERSPAKKEKSPGKKERSPGKKERSPAKEERSPGKKERSPAKEEPRLLAVRRLRRAARADKGPDKGTESDLRASYETDLRVRLGELESRLEATRRMRGVDLGENDGARDESWLEDAGKRSANDAGKKAKGGGVDSREDDSREDEDESNPWFAPPSPDAEGSRLGAMPARAPASNAGAGGSNDDDDDRYDRYDDDDDDGSRRKASSDSPGEHGATSKFAHTRLIEARLPLEEGEVLGSNPSPSAERRGRLEREEARELRELLRRQEERRRRRRRRLERRGEKVADFLPLFAAAALLGGAGKLVRGVFFGKKPGRG